jgi:hypothetical protein
MPAQSLLAQVLPLVRGTPARTFRPGDGVATALINQIVNPRSPRQPRMLRSWTKTSRGERGNQGSTTFFICLRRWPHGAGDDTARVRGGMNGKANIASWPSADSPV